MIAAADLYSNVQVAILQPAKYRSIHLHPDTWRDLMWQLKKDGPKVTLPSHQGPLPAPNAEDTQGCVGLLHGLPVILDDAVSIDGFELR